MTTHELKEFDMSEISTKPNCNIIVIGKRNTGKSTLIKYILYYIRNVVPMIIAMSGTERTNNFYKKILPEMLVYEEVDSNKFQPILDRQIQLREKILNKKSKYKNTNPNIALVLDDCVDRTDWTKDDAINFFTTNGRHAALTFIVVTQESKKLPPSMRTNADYIFISKTNGFTERKKIRDDYLGMISDKKECDRIFSEYTKDYKFLVVDNVTKNTNVKNQLFWCKANPNIQTDLCDPVYWRLNKIIQNVIYKQIQRKEKEKEQNVKGTNNIIRKIKYISDNEDNEYD
jgi:hypothetical protein